MLCLQFEEQLMKEQAAAVKKEADELGATVAQMQFDKTKPVFHLLLQYSRRCYTQLLI